MKKYRICLAIAVALFVAICATLAYRHTISFFRVSGLLIVPFGLVFGPLFLSWKLEGDK